MESLLIRTLNNSDDSSEWVVIDHSGYPHAAVRKGALSAAGAQSKHRQVVVLVPSEDLVINHIEFPSKNRRKMRQAVPFILEDQLAADIEDMHFAIGNNPAAAINGSAGQQSFPVAVIDQVKMEHWVEQFKSSNLEPRIVMPDVLAVPYYENTWSLLINEKITLVRTGPCTGFACDTVNCTALLTAAVKATAVKPELIKIWNYKEESFDHIEHIIQIEGQDPEDEIPIEYESTNVDQISLLARGLKINGKANHPINLLQGEYTNQEDYGKLFKPWQTTATLALIWAILLFAINSIQLYRLSGEDKALLKQMQTIYKSTIPGAKTVSNPAQIMRSKLKELGGSSSINEASFIGILSLVAKELSESQATIESITFNKQQLDIEVEVATPQELDKLKENIDKKPSINTEILNSTTRGEKVDGRIRITRSK